MTVGWSITIALAAGFALDLLLGERLSAISPAVLFGKLIAVLERVLRRAFPADKRGERLGGTLLVVIVCIVAFVVPMALLGLCWIASPWLHLALETFWCYQIMATRGLRDAALEVHRELRRHDIVAARRAVGMVVGRDTERLTPTGVTKAAVETVAENASDGAIAPLFYFAIGGAPLSMLYKAINTMDSMLGYKNDRYRNFGTAAARLDDVANFVPSRLCALLIVAVAGPLGFDARGAWRIWRRDHANHASPNSAQSESAVAGALGIRLLGDAYYFGRLVEKPTVGDPTRPVKPGDIIRANKLLYASAGVACALGLFVRVVVLLLLAI